MDTFADRLISDTDERFQLYLENIPNFKTSLIPIENSIKTIKNLLEDIAYTQKQLHEPCKDSCINCTSRPHNECFGLEAKPEKLGEVHVGPEKSSLEIENQEQHPKQDNLVNVKKDIRIVAQISEDEYRTIPKYQIGRITLEMLNEIVGKMDEFLLKKSKILGKKNKQLTKIDREMLDSWRELEDKAKRRLPTSLFFIENDIRPTLQERLRPFFAKAIPCLRHIRRIREERCGPLTFYYP